MAGDVVWPASIFQRSMLALEPYLPGFTGQWFTMNAAVRLTGPLDRRVLVTALAELLRRHEVLRTRVVDDGAGPVQVVSAKVQAIVDDADDGGPIHVPVEPSAPLVVRLARSGPREHVLYLHLHHLIADPDTVWGVLTELGALYSAYAGGGALPGGPSAQYGQYAAFEAEQSRAGRQAARRWWAGAVGGREFATLCCEGSGVPFAYRDELLSAGELGMAHRLARTHRATIMTTLLAALSCAVRPRVGAGGIMFRTVFSKRDRPEWRRVLGPCILLAYLPLPDPPELLNAGYARRVRDALLGAQRHCRYEMDAVQSLMTSHDPAKPLPFFEYVPDRWPTEVRFGAATGRVVNAAGPKDRGQARGFAVRARVNADGALVGHISGDSWTKEVAEEILRGMRTQIRAACDQPNPNSSASPTGPDPGNDSVPGS